MNICEIVDLIHVSSSFNQAITSLELQAFLPIRIIYSGENILDSALGAY
jgi:hypothetical protein